MFGFLRRRLDPTISERLARTKVLSDVLRHCPRCSAPIVGHEYRLVASVPLVTDQPKVSAELLSAIRDERWQDLVAFQEWQGDRTNAEVFAIRCPDGGLSVAVIAAPFALEEPYVLILGKAVASPGVLSGLLPSEGWVLAQRELP
jgi:hypothetical protein